MAETSSTSSSEHEDLPPGIPKAFLLSLVIVLVVEVLVRGLGPRRMNPYAVGEYEYDAVAAELADEGPAEVTFLGTSREREAIALPMVREVLKEKLGRSISVGSYATSGARAAEIEVIAEAVLRRGKPSLVMYGIQPRTLLGLQEVTSRMAVLWKLEDWRRYRAREPERYDDALLPSVLRAEMGELYRTLRYRSRPSAMVLDLYAVLANPPGPRTTRDVLLLEPIPSPVLGDLTFPQRYQPSTSLATRPVSEEHVEKYVKSVLENGHYELTPRKTEQLRRTLQRFQQAGVPIVLFEVPLSEILVRHLPAGTMDDFRRIVRQVASETGVRFVSVEELGVKLDDSEFLEQSHVNLKGAKRLTKALTDAVIVPVLEMGAQASHAVTR